VESGKYAERVRRDFTEGASVGVNGTPHTIVYSKRSGKQARIGGALPLEAAKEIIDRVIAGKLQDDKESLAPAEVLAIKPDDHVFGDRNADLIIIEYSDLECPFCMRFHDTMRQVMETYTSVGVAWVYRHFPLTNIHPDAQKYAEGAECIRELGNDDLFWKFTDELFSQMKRGIRVDSSK